MSWLDPKVLERLAVALRVEGEEPVGALAKKIDWTKPPVVLWQHVMKAKPDATVQVAAAGNPLILTRPYGKGQICFVAAAPQGDAPPGETAFWDWSQWPALMGTVIRDLLAATR